MGNFPLLTRFISRASFKANELKEIFFPISLKLKKGRKGHPIISSSTLALSFSSSVSSNTSKKNDKKTSEECVKKDAILIRNLMPVDNFSR